MIYFEKNFYDVAFSINLQPICCIFDKIIFISHFYIYYEQRAPNNSSKVHPFFTPFFPFISSEEYYEFTEENLAGTDEEAIQLLSRMPFVHRTYDGRYFTTSPRSAHVRRNLHGECGKWNFYLKKKLKQHMQFISQFNVTFFFFFFSAPAG